MPNKTVIRSSHRVQNLQIATIILKPNTTQGHLRSPLAANRLVWHCKRKMVMQKKVPQGGLAHPVSFKK
jgi:hypothetical protein